MSTMKVSDMCKRIGVIALCVVMLCTVINFSAFLTGSAAPGDTPQATPVFNTLDNVNQLFAPTLTPEGEYPAIGGANNWSVDGNNLVFKKDKNVMLSSDALTYAENNIIADFKVYDFNGNQTDKFSKPTKTGPFDVAAHMHVTNGSEDSKRNFGYLDFVDVGSSHIKTLTNNYTIEASSDFYAEIDLVTGSGQSYDSRGIMIAPAGEFAYTNDGNNANDKGILIGWGNNFKPIAAGAVDVSTVKATVGSFYTGPEPAENTNNIYRAGAIFTKVGAVVGTTGFHPYRFDWEGSDQKATMFTLAVQVKDGVLSYWNKNDKNANVMSVELTNAYAGGNISMYSTSCWSGAFAGLRIKDMADGQPDKTWTCSYAVTRNQMPKAMGVQSAGDYGESQIPVSDLLVDPISNRNPMKVTVDTVRRDVTYKKADAALADINYGLVALKEQHAATFELSVDVTKAANSLISFAAANQADGLVGAQAAGVYSIITAADGAVKLVENGATVADGTISGFNATAKYTYNIKVDSSNNVVVKVNNAQVISAPITPVAGSFVFGANTEDTVFGALKVNNAANDAFDTIQKLKEKADCWYMPLMSNEPAIYTESVTAYGNWYVNDKTIGFKHSNALKQPLAAIQAGVSMTIYSPATDATKEQSILYKSSNIDIDAVGNYGIAMLKDKKYNDFKLKLTVLPGSGVPYIGFGAQGGSYGSHIGQSKGGYAVYLPVNNAITNKSMCKVVSYDPANRNTYDISRSNIFGYDPTVEHTYVIEVKNRVINVWVDGVQMTREGGTAFLDYHLQMYQGGYVYVAMNKAGGGIKDATITAYDEIVETEVDISNTDVYEFDNVNDIDAFEQWYLYNPGDTGCGDPAIKITDSGKYTDNWYMGRQQTLSFQYNNLYKAPVVNPDTGKKEVHATVDGYEYSETGGYPEYSANFGIAVTKKEYKNFIMDIDIEPSGRHFILGFGAQGGKDGVSRTQVDGGFGIRLNKKGSNDIAQYQFGRYQGLEGQKWVSNYITRSEIPFNYSGKGYVHLRLVVTGGVAYYYFGDATTPIVANLKGEYEGGRITLSVNHDQNTSFDNLRIVDLDKQTVDVASIANASAGTIDIDRAAGQSLTDIIGSQMDVQDVNGYDYNVPVNWASTTYRSYIPGNHTFTLAAGETNWHNVVVTEGGSTGIIVNNMVNDLTDITGATVTTDTTRKYYFDHPNDLLDFRSQESQLLADGVTYSGQNGKLLDDPDRSAWTTVNGLLENTNAANPGAWAALNRVKSVTALYVNDYHPVNFRMEMDFWKEPSNWWYTYMVFGVQDPQQFYLKLTNGTADPVVDNAWTPGLNGNWESENPGVWVYIEQEGPIHLCGLYYDHNSRRGDQDVFREDRDGSTYMIDAMAKRNERHHMSIEVVGNQCWVQIDDSATYYFSSIDYALGGFFGVASHRQGQKIDNFQFTALDDKGNVINLADAKQMAQRPNFKETYEGWTPEDDFEWGDEYK